MECAVIVTSGSSRWGLTALEGARVVMLEPLRRDEAMRLLSGLIGRSTHHAVPAEIARLCDDPPLALRPAAGNLMGRRPAERTRYQAGLRSQNRLSLLAVSGDPAASAAHLVRRQAPDGLRVDPLDSAAEPMPSGEANARVIKA